MSRSTFILIVSIYGFLLGLSMLITPSLALEYFGRDTNDVYLRSLMGFFGTLHIAFNFVGISLRNHGDKALVRVYLLSLVWLLVVSTCISYYDVTLRAITPHKTFYFDTGLWIVLAAGALYFWFREKD